MSLYSEVARLSCYKRSGVGQAGVGPKDESIAYLDIDQGVGGLWNDDEGVAEP